MKIRFELRALFVVLAVASIFFAMMMHKQGLAALTVVHVAAVSWMLYQTPLAIAAVWRSIWVSAVSVALVLLFVASLPVPEGMHSGRGMVIALGLPVVVLYDVLAAAITAAISCAVSALIVDATLDVASPDRNRIECLVRGGLSLLIGVCVIKYALSVRY